MGPQELEADLKKWQEERAERLQNSERSWLNLAALYWLKPGDNTFGSASSNDFVLPAGAPVRAGTFHFVDGAVTVTVAPGITMACNGGKVPSRPLLDDQKNAPDFLEMGRFVFVVLLRGSSTLIRLWDKESPRCKEFTGLDFYPYKPEYCIQAEYEGYAPFKIVQQEDIIGEISDRKMLGYITFTFQGQKYRLDAEDGSEGLFIAFRDRTNADTTYAGGRYLMTDMPKDGRVTVDFNRAFNMPCGYTVYATCGLATQQNWLPVRIDAGEKKYPGGH